MVKYAVIRKGLPMKEASFYEKEGDNLRCFLCPHHCRIPADRLGLCGTRKNAGGKLYAYLYGTVIAAHSDPVEKKPLFHFLPGSRTFSIAGPGCNLRCGFCQNWQISQLDRVHAEEIPKGTTTPEEILGQVQQAGLGSISYTYTEPTVAYEFVYECAVKARAEGIRSIMVTNGYINPEPLKELVQYVDAFNIDLKAMDEEFYRKTCGGTLGPVLESLVAVRSAGRWLEVTNLIIPGLNSDETQIAKLIDFVKNELGDDVPLHFSGFYPTYKLTGIEPTSAAVLERACRMAKERGLLHVYAGNIRTEGWEHTYCPSCKKAVILRSGYTILEKNVMGNKCAFCQAPIAGVFA